MKDHQDEIYDMSIKESQTTSRQAVLQQKFHPGFQCFFKDFLEKASINFNQCFTQLVQGSRSLQQIKYSLPNILKMNHLKPEQKKKLLSTKQHKILYFYQDDKGTFANDLIDQSAKEQDTIQMLQRRLLMYQEMKQKLLSQKVEEINKRKKPIQQAKGIVSPPQNEIPKLINSENSGNQTFSKSNGKIL